MERIITPQEIFEDGSTLSLRPQNLQEYIGQDKVKERLNIFIKAAQNRNEALDHVLLYGRDLPKFTLIGATTRIGMLTSPLRDRFGVLCDMQYYTEDQLKEIIIRSAFVLNCNITEEGAYELARRSRGTPRIANRLLKRVRDYAEVYSNSVISYKEARAALELLEVDSKGFDRVDNKILEAIIDNFNGGPVGIETLSYFIGEELGTIEDVYEPYLLQTGFIVRTSRGRVATDKAYEHLGRNKNNRKTTGEQQKLF